MFDEVLPAAAPVDDFFDAAVPAASVAPDADLLEATAPPADDGGFDDLLSETVQRPTGRSEPHSPPDALAETALRPDALGETFFREDPGGLDADASGFFDDMTFRPSGMAPAAESLDAELDVLDVTAPRASKSADEEAPAKDFYTATTIIPSAVLPEDPPERTLVFKAPPLTTAPAGAAPVTPPVPPPAPVASDDADDFFMLEPPAPVEKLDPAFADFGMDDPVIELPTEPEPAAPPRRVYNLDTTQDVAHFEGDDDPPLSEKTVVLPNSPLARGKRPPE